MIEVIFGSGAYSFAPVLLAARKPSLVILRHSREGGKKAGTYPSSFPRRRESSIFTSTWHSGTSFPSCENPMFLLDSRLRGNDVWGDAKTLDSRLRGNDEWRDAKGGSM